MTCDHIAVVEGVLTRHGIDVGEWEAGMPPAWTDDLAELLRLAEGDVAPSLEIERSLQNEHARRVERVDLLERLIASYGKDFARDERYARSWIRDNGGDFGALKQGLKDLLRGENRLLMDRPQGKLPSNRPRKAKNECACQMVEILTRQNLQPYPACQIVAEMFAEAGIGNPDPQQEAKNLWDRVR